MFIIFTGGQLGLWVGISAVTVCEFLDLIAQIIAHLWRGSTAEHTTNKQAAGQSHTVITID